MVANQEEAKVDLSSVVSTEQFTQAKIDLSAVVSTQQFNQAKSYIKKLVIKDGEITNLGEWSDGVVGCAQALNATMFFHPTGCIPVAEADRDSACRERDASIEVPRIKTSSSELTKERRDEARELIKLLQKQNRALDEKKDNTLEELNTRRIGYFVQASMALEEPNDPIHQNAFLKRKLLIQGALGKLFKVKIPSRKGKGVVWWAPLESKRQSLLRAVMFSQLEKSLSPTIDSKLWKDFQVGDCYGLHNYVLTTYGKNRKEERTNSVLKRFENLSKFAGVKNVDEWFMNIGSVKRDANKVGVVIDDAMFKLKIENAVFSSGVKLLENAWKKTKLKYERHIKKGGQVWDFETFFSSFRERYVNFSQGASIPIKKSVNQVSSGGGNGDGGGNGGGGGKGGRGGKGKRGGRGGGRGGRGGRGGKNNSGGGGAETHQQTDTPICLFHNSDRGCLKGDNCRMRHVKVHGEELEALRERVRLGRERKAKERGGGGDSEVVCYVCGKKGHKSFECPNRTHTQQQGANAPARTYTVGSKSSQSDELVKEMMGKLDTILEKVGERVARDSRQ